LLLLLLLLLEVEGPLLGDEDTDDDDDDDENIDARNEDLDELACCGLLLGPVLAPLTKSRTFFISSCTGVSSRALSSKVGTLMSLSSSLSSVIVGLSFVFLLRLRLRLGASSLLSPKLLLSSSSFVADRTVILLDEW
jgi:hypothetical protein